MSEGRRHRERFFAKHPSCCFCGGGAPANTIDHIPLRAAFARRIGPEGFEFPACKACNEGTKGSEHVFALYVRLFDRNDENYDQVRNAALVRGVHNNYPDLLPKVDLSASEQRKALRRWGLKLPRGTFLSDTGLASVPGIAAQHIGIATMKLLAALYYRHINCILTSEHAVFTAWSQQGLPNTNKALQILTSSLPELVEGQRVNTSIGDQFAYRWGINPIENLFSFAAGFGHGLLLTGGAAPIASAAGHRHWSPYIPPRLITPAEEPIDLRRSTSQLNRRNFST